MNSHHPDSDSVARRYIGTNDPLERLGWGVDGVVYHVRPRSAAIKVHSRPETFNHELAAYQRLTEHGVDHFQGFAVPRLLRFDEALRVIEMTIVQPPFLLDFAAARVDEELDFPEGLDEWMERVRANFGDEDFPVAQSVFWGLVNSYGIYYFDLKPGNLQIR